MTKKRISKKRKFLKVVRNSPLASGLKSISLRSDYFIRFKYSIEEVLDIIETEPVRTLQINSETREILDDLGYWSLVRSEDGNYRFDNDLKEQLIAQYEYLERRLNYTVGELVWAKKNDNSFAQAKILEHVSSEDSDFYAVEFKLTNINDEKQAEVQIFSKYELDQINQVGCFLPQDIFDSELIDWDKDLIWKKRLEDFKIQMAEKKFSIDFRKTSYEIAEKISELSSNILSFFKINIGNDRQIGRGLGLRSCGEGSVLDQYLVYFGAIQACGHVFGLKLTDINHLASDFFNEINKSKISLDVFKSIAEVAEKLVARGPLVGSDEPQVVKTIDRISRKTAVEKYINLKNLKERRSLLKAISESLVFSNIVQFNANSI
jgi:hypothetical protein